MDDKTKVNGYPLDMFNANLLNYTVGACEYNNGYFVPANSMFPVKLKGNIGVRPITLEIDFEGNSIKDITMSISDFTSMLQSKAEILLPDGFNYTCCFDDVSEPEQKAPWIMQVKFSLSGYRHGAMEFATLTGNSTLSVKGNYETPAIIKIIPNDATQEVTVNGITVKNITDTVVIDGINKTVMENGVNKFLDTNLTEFPALKSGNNNIEISGNATVEISYYPIYL
jgi:phage-related protein